jgi:hypothetical protein
MVLFVRWLLVLPLLVVTAAPATAATRNAPPCLRTTLDDSTPAPAATAPRRIRSSLDDAASARATIALPGTSAAHAEFPLEKSGAKVAGRLIRLSLDDGQATYGHLALAQPASRRIRTSLD